MLNNLSIKKKLAVGIGAIVAILLILLTLAYTNFAKLSVASSWDRHTQEVLLEANRIETALLQIQASARGYVLTGDERTAQPIADQEEQVHQHINTMLRLTADNPAEQERLLELVG